jgi:uncharacterized protein (TIGR02145 family)
MDTCPDFPPVSSSSGDVVVDGSSSSVQLFDFCVYANLRECLAGPVAVCPGGGIPSNSCPDFPPVAVSSSSSEAVVSVSSSSKEKFERCVYDDLKVCIDGPVAKCQAGGRLSNDPCPTFEVSSSSVAVVSSSSREKFDFCVYESFKVCIPGPVSKCQTGGVLSNECPLFPGDACEDSYNDYSTFRARSYYCSNGRVREYGSLIDVRDGQRYKTVVIGDDEWMAENFKYMPAINDDFGDPLPIDFNRCYGVAVSEAGKVTDSYECNLLGRYYNWGTVMNFTTVNCNISNYNSTCSALIQTPYHQGICPEGWHVPTKSDFETLLAMAGDNEAEKFNNLKARELWINYPATTDKFGFSLLGHGHLAETATSANFCMLNSSATYYLASLWSSTMGTSSNSTLFMTNRSQNGLTELRDTSRSQWTPLRCVKDK